MNVGMSNMTVRSADGTRIALTSYGDGAPLVVVPGALCDHTAWMSCALPMARGRSVHVIDRRGRGASGDARSYAPDREVDDVLAVLATLGPEPDLLGHSSGAILALQAAERAPVELRRLVLYEPPLFFDDADAIPADLPERLDALLADGDDGREPWRRSSAKDRARRSRRSRTCVRIMPRGRGCSPWSGPSRTTRGSCATSTWTSAGSATCGRRPSC